jgi:hypothetical protein
MIRSLAVATVLLATAAPAAMAGEYGLPQMVSRPTTTEQPAGDSWQIDVTPDGRYVVYVTDAPNVPDERPSRPDGAFTVGGGVFRLDRATGRTDLVAYRYFGSGAGIGFGAVHPQISADGRYVAFDTYPLLASDAFSYADYRNSVYVRDMRLPVNDRAAYQPVTILPGEVIPTAGSYQAMGLSDDGRRVLFGDFYKLYWRDLDAHRTLDVGVRYDSVSDAMSDVVASKPSYAPQLSGDGTTVAWETADAGSFTRTPPGAGAAQQRAILARRMADGPRARTHRVAGSIDTDDPGCTGAVPVTTAPARPTPCDNTALDALSLPPSPTNRGPSFGISRDGYTIAFASSGHARGSDLPASEDVYVTTAYPGETRKAVTRPLTRVVPGGDTTTNAPVIGVALSPDGRYVGFATQRVAFALAPPAFIGDPSPGVRAQELYVVDREAQTMQLLTRTPGGTQQTLGTPRNASWEPPSDGVSDLKLADRAVASVFTSSGDNLVAGDANQYSDVFFVPRLPTGAGSTATGPELQVVPPIEARLEPQPDAARTAPPGAKTAPVARLRVTMRRHGSSLLLRVRAPGAGAITAEARQGARRLARSEVRAKRAGSVALTLRLRHARAGRASVAVRFRPAAGTRTTHSATLTLRSAR